MPDDMIPSEESREPALNSAKRKTREYAERLWEIISRHSRIHQLGETDSVTRREIEQYRHPRGRMLRLLALIPYLLLMLFGLSFFWDFPGMSWTLWGYTLSFGGLLKIISISGLIGYLTNWLAITMLFKPSQKRPLLGQGLIPAQKERIAYRLAQAVSEDLINPEIIKRRISETGMISRYREESTRYLKGIIDDPGFRRELKSWVVEYTREMIADPTIRTAMAEKIIQQMEETLEDKSLERVALKAYSFIRGQQMQEIIEEALARIPGSIEGALNKTDELLDQLPEKVEQNSETIENVVTSLLYKLVNQLDVHSLVEDNLREYDNDRISGIIRGATNEQLRYIQYLGAVLGMVGGLVIWEPVLSVLVLSLAGGMLLVADTLLYRLKS